MSHDSSRTRILARGNKTTAVSLLHVNNHDLLASGEAKTTCYKNHPAFSLIILSKTESPNSLSIYIYTFQKNMIYFCNLSIGKQLTPPRNYVAQRTVTNLTIHVKAKLFFPVESFSHDYS